MSSCSSCHIGHGWTDDSFDFTAEERVDCLACHDTTGTYTKDPKLAKPNLRKVARSVGATSRASCGACHFKGGGGVAVWVGWMARQARDIPAYVSPHSAEGLVGEHGTVTVDLDPEGEVMVAGERWGARMADDQNLEAGTEIDVSSVQGLVLIVDPGESDTTQQ